MAAANCATKRTPLGVPSHGRLLVWSEIEADVDTRRPRVAGIAYVPLRHEAGEDRAPAIRRRDGAESRGQVGDEIF